MTSRINNFINLELYQIDLKQILKNYTILIVGLFVMSMGVALSVKSDLGTTPISCIPYVLSYAFPLSLGTITIIFNMLLILIQIILLRSHFPKIQLLQILVNCVFGYFIDVSLSLTSFVVPASYVMQWVICILSCFVIAFGVFLEVNSHAIVLPGEGVSLSVRYITHVDFGKIKVGFDTSNVLIGVILSLGFFGTFRGVGLGTVFAGIVVGYIVKMYRNIITSLMDYINKA